MKNPIPTVFITKRENIRIKNLKEELNDILYGEELNDILYGEELGKVEFNTIEEAKAYQETLDKTKYFSYIACVTYVPYSGNE